MNKIKIANVKFKKSAKHFQNFFFGKLALKPRADFLENFVTTYLKIDSSQTLDINFCQFEKIFESIFISFSEHLLAFYFDKYSPGSSCFSFFSEHQKQYIKIEHRRRSQHGF